jgi:hypothetical protein
MKRTSVAVIAAAALALLALFAGLHPQHKPQPPPAPVQRTSDVVVWVNTNTHVYHLPGSRWYQNTRHGTLMPERAAVAEGDRPAENGQ